MNIHISSKFHFANNQYKGDAGGFTLLRLTYGSTGGAIKTATAGDRFGSPSFQDRSALIEAFRMAIVKLGGSISLVQIRHDSAGRVFGEFNGVGTESDFLNCLECLTQEMGKLLNLETAENSVSLYVRNRPEEAHDLQEIYDAICHAEGEPAYLSDGVFLLPDGSLAEL